VQYARLGVYRTNADGNRTVNVHRITTSWTETGVTWNNFGGGYDPTVLGSFQAGGSGWKTVYATDLVQRWVDGTYANYGLLLDDPTTVADENEVYRSSEDSTVSTRPELEICYRQECIPGDLDCDCEVDIMDIMLVASIWHTAAGDPDFNPDYDLDGNSRIDIVDIMLVAVHWGERC
jgi:hypothetical protein